VSSPICPTTLVRPAEDHLASDLGEETVLMSVATGEYYGLRGVGTLVWAELQIGPRTVADLVSRIIEEYDVEETRALTDLTRLLEDMQARKLVEIEN